MKANKIILGMIGGLATGAILSILFAPESGKNTRKKIKDKSKEFKDNMKQDFDKMLQKIDNKYHSLSENAHHFLCNGKSKIENMTGHKN